MLNNITHAGGIQEVDEVLFTTPFDYMFPEAAKSPECLLPVSSRTEDALLALGAAMGDAVAPPDPAFDSNIPAAFTYLGQFIDHDVTARTDRESGMNVISQADGRPAPLHPVAPDTVVATLRNGRRPQLDLDSLYGDGPGLIPTVATEASSLYDGDKKLKIQSVDTGYDVPREGAKALIADMRNDENLNISQLHSAFLAFHNKVADLVPNAATTARRYSKARQIVRWAYQYLVINDYLTRVCDPEVVDDVLRNGPQFFGPDTGGTGLFMPLEFSIAGFRFGHSMIRPSYRINGTTILSIGDILVPSRGALLETSGGATHLKAVNLIHWSNFVQFQGRPAPQMTRRIDPMISAGLFDLPFDPHIRAGAMMRHLAQRNLCRGYLLSVPTGQAMAAAMGVVPLLEDDLFDGETAAIKDAISAGRFQRRTPLWYYVLREGKVQKQGNSLGAVGSRLVAETIVGFIKHDPNSFLNNLNHTRVTNGGIKVPGRAEPIGTLADMLDYTGVPK